MITCETMYENDTNVEGESIQVVKLAFYSDAGKFGTEELLDDYHFTAEELLDILQAWREINNE